ncbi:DMT family transporter [Candidatus Peregrinibacteria bacterium]|nr:DMT family transporter [Candidatus Peregrinibacteria bacterium]
MPFPIARSWQGYFFLLLTIIGGSTFSVFARQLSEIFSPLSMLFIGEISIVLFVLLSYGFLPMLRQFLTLTMRETALLLLFSALIIAGLGLWYMGLRTTEAVNAELIGKAETLFTIFFAVTLLREHLQRRHIASGILMLSGILIVVLRDINGGFHLHGGDAFIILGGFCFSVASIVFKKKFLHLPPEFILLFRSSFTVLLFFLVSPFLQHPFITELRRLPLSLIPVLLSFAFLSRFLSVLGFYEAIERLPLTIIYLTLPLSTILALLFAHAYLGEPLHISHGVGGILIIGSVLLLNIHGPHMKQHPRHHI